MTGLFLRDIVRYWRDPGDKWIKAAVYIGIIAHITVLISVKTGWWDEYFFTTTNNKLIQACDFFAIYVAGHELLAGESIYSTMDDNPDFRDIAPYYCPFRYLPIAATIGIALNAFNPWAAYWFWVVISELLFFGSIVILGRHFGTMRQIHIALALYLLYIPLYAELFLGQFNLLQSVLILAMILAAAGGALGRFHLWWTASVLWKMNTIFCVPALIRWRVWKPLLWLLLIVLFTCGPYFMLHPGDLQKYFYTNVRIPGRLDLAEKGIQSIFAEMETIGNLSVQGLITQANMKRTLYEGIKINPTYNFVSWFIFLAIGLYATIRARKDRFAECVCLWVLMYFMVYTNIWEYHYMMLLPVVTFLYLRYRGILLLLCWFMLAIPPGHLGYASALPNWDITFIRPIAAVMLFGFCVYCTIRKPGPGREETRITR